MLDLKTTTSIYFLPNILKIFSDSELDFEPLCYLLGQYFQINDDYLNLTDDTFQKMKGEPCSACVFDFGALEFN